MSKENPRLLETRLEPEKAVLVGVSCDPRRRSEEEDSLVELSELARSAGAEVVDTYLQAREAPDPAYFAGTGLLAQIREEGIALQVDAVIFDDELTAGQVRNLEEFLQLKVVDRTELILDIFGQRAKSSEGKLQVELAQLEYLLPRLTGKGVTLSRLGGGIGTRGPGEKKLETDRRRIRHRISTIRDQLARLEQRRELHRRKRRGVPIPTVSLVGYTNAGKSTLFTRLCHEDTFVSPRMFATLDPLVRKVELGSGHEILVTDTVGFIRKLPHSLVSAFHATLEETLEADLLVHVIDLAHPNFEALREAVYGVLSEIGGTGCRVLEVYNKLDLVRKVPPVSSDFDWVAVSAKTGQGIDRLVSKLEEMLRAQYVRVSLTIPFDRGELLARLRERSMVLVETYEADGIHLEASVPVSELNRYSAYLTGA